MALPFLLCKSEYWTWQKNKKRKNRSSRDDRIL